MDDGNGHSPKGRGILREAPEMKYVFIENHQAEFSIKAMCRVLCVARSGWYVWRNRCTVINAREQFRQRYGAPRLAEELRAQGLTYNVKTIGASLRRQGLRRKPHAGSVRSATVSMACRCQRSC
ncbi:helix-turn-helix protein [Erwinia sp. JUb26]|nr:helix-turn-helix protein [Erwinia sp. JUb26]